MLMIGRDRQQPLMTSISNKQSPNSIGRSNLIFQWLMKESVLDPEDVLFEVLSHFTITSLAFSIRMKYSPNSFNEASLRKFAISVVLEQFGSPYPTNIVDFTL